ncbi:hypothetical protein [Mycoplasma sp. Mirounga ES2805-ORL]|uniref:hypothetical protein n=1 Tax=Mycoplasma sp. Mirounga ES2805-ORL TaxID=754514 RepID=UPI00197C3C6E|nr:hypothetical protein [Mycoplasma sp. Mirounga ES2805-ORL]QSF13630.1 hypothetical protein JXZ90_03110 [Mycoplasma sp. Mirounga ES2805-ORL]
MFEYIKNGLHWKRIIHLIVVILISLCLSLIYWFIDRTKNVSNNIKTINILMFSGLFFLSYAIVILAFKHGLGKGFFDYQKNKKDDVLNDKLQYLKNQPNTVENRAIIKSIENQIEDRKFKKECAHIHPKNNLIFYLIILLGIILLAIAIGLHFS